MNFINSNSHKFSEDEENKHEYFQLHQDYIHMLEQAIDIQIEQKYQKH